MVRILYLSLSCLLLSAASSEGYLRKEADATTAAITKSRNYKDHPHSNFPGMNQANLSTRDKRDGANGYHDDNSDPSATDVNGVGGPIADMIHNALGIGEESHIQADYQVCTRHDDCKSNCCTQLSQDTHPMCYRSYHCN